MSTPSNALALVDEPDASPAPLLPSPAEFRTIREIGEVMAASGFFRGALKPAQAIAAVLAGRDYGIGPWQSLSLMHVIEGKPTLSADAMAGLVNRWCRRNGGYLRVVEQTPQRCTVAFRRPEWPDESRVAFTIAEAQTAGLAGKDNWRKYPADMLKARALARACRTGFPDVTAGLYLADELGQAETRAVAAGDIAPSLGAGPVIEAEARELAPEPDPAEDRVAIEPNEWGGSDEQIDADEAEEIAWRERCEAARDNDDWKGLIEAANGDEWRWAVLMVAAPDIGTLKRLKASAKPLGMQTETVLAAFEAREAALTKRADRHTN